MKNEKENYSCCFFGHRKINETAELKERLIKTVKNLVVENSVNTFYFGSKSDFDSLCLKTISDLKIVYPHIKRIYVRTANADIDENYLNYLSQYYDATYFPEKLRNSGKCAYAERNREIIERSKFCVTYFNPNYAPPKRKTANGIITEYQPQSGTKIAYEYALKKKKEIINLFNE